MKEDPYQELNAIAQILYDKKGFNILALDVQGISTLTDFFIIAEGSVDKHVLALAEAVMKEMGERPVHAEGLKQGDWVVLDYMSIVIHLFMPGLRDTYRLEKLWHEGKVVDLKLKTKVKH